MSGQPLDKVQKNLINLLAYAKEIHTIRSNVILDYTSLPVRSAKTGHELISHENVRLHELAPEEAWLSIDRVERTQPPMPPEGTEIFLRGVQLDKLTMPPEMKTLASARVSIEQASDLLEAELITASDVMPLKASDDTSAGYSVDVILRLEKFPHLKRAFDSWYRETWSTWAELERAREKQITLYRHYFQIHQELRHKSDEFELVILQNMVTLKSPEGDVIKAPLLEHAVDITVDESEGYALVITPRDIPPRIVTEPFVAAMLPGSGQLRASLQKHLEAYSQQSERVDILFDAEFTARVGMTAASVLHPEAYYDGDASGLPPATDLPVSTGIWMLVLKPKSLQPYIDNIDSLTEQIKSTSPENLPEVAIAFGSEPSDEKIDESIDFNLSAGFGQSYGLQTEGSSLARADQSAEVFFPLVYNPEQVEILRQVETSDAVSVQGPPGTGKSHTIANIVSHYMATGRRVLITAKTPEALAGVRSKLPETLAKLTISVLDNDNDGKKQVEDAINFISSQVQGLKTDEATSEIHSLETAIQGMRDRIAIIENALVDHATSQLQKIEYKQESMTPAQLVKLIQLDINSHAWFPDLLSLDSSFEPQFTDAQIMRLRVIRRELGSDLNYAGQNLPDLSSLPDVPALRRMHERLAQAKVIDKALLSGDIPEPAENTPDFEARMHSAAETLDGVALLKAHLQTHQEWRALVINLFSPVAVANERKEIIRVLNDARKWMESIEPLMVYGINLSGLAWDDNDLITAVGRASEGEKPFGALAFFKSKAKRTFESIEIRGSQPRSAEEWRSVKEMIDAFKQFNTLNRQWQVLSGYMEFPPLPDTVTEALKFLKKHRPILEIGAVNYDKWTQTLEDLKALYPYSVDHEAVAKLGTEFDRLYDGLRKWLNKIELSDAQQIPKTLLEYSEMGTGWVYEKLNVVSRALGGDYDTTQVGDLWRAVRDKIETLKRKQPLYDELISITDCISRSGAPKWAQRLCSLPIEGEEDALTPGDWAEAWNLSRARGFINQLPSREKIAELADEQTMLESDIRRKFDRLIELRALLGLKQNMTQRIAQGLARFAAAFSKIGRNVTAKRSKQHWQEARDAMQDCYDAIPCWIIPEGRVAEQIPAKLKVFDLVITDEASQSDITSIPVILRGKKLLVVGDDKQVSPSLVGIKEERINQLMDDLLSSHPLKNTFHPTQSLYDLVGIMSPGKRTSLKEHFRCVEPIIRFCSKHFYSEPLIPLRIPKSEERLDPPLVDIWVKNGRKVKDRNDAEADVIVDEIVKITEDPEMQHRSIGVISLIGHKQAHEISKRLFDRIGVEAMERHNIECGDARFFQGQERDIIFLSMVASPGDCRAQTGRDNQQRFNVAVSRARDRLVLVRSVGTKDLNNPDDLKAALIEHFERPMVVTPEDRELISLCESEFERQVFSRLVADNYRVIPQFEAGNYRIDLVVEGDNDRRLAIELDGDAYHGPDKYAKDLTRQKQLERVGWIFWRCWASSWYIDSDNCYQDLLTKLSSMGIEPIGSDYHAEVYVRHETRGEEESSDELFELLEHIAEEPSVAAQSIEITSPPESVENIDWIDDLDLADEEELVVEVGDRVVIRYEDTPDKTISLKISTNLQDPANGVIRMDEPLPQAILGAMIGDEFEVETDRLRAGTVLSIEKAKKITTLDKESRLTEHIE